MGHRSAVFKEGGRWSDASRMALRIYDGLRSLLLGAAAGIGVHELAVADGLSTPLLAGLPVGLVVAIAWFHRGRLIDAFLRGDLRDDLAREHEDLEARSTAELHARAEERRERYDQRRERQPGSR